MYYTYIYLEKALKLIQIRAHLEILDIADTSRVAFAY